MDGWTMALPIKKTNGSRAAVLATSKLFSTTVKSKPFPLKVP